MAHDRVLADFLRILAKRHGGRVSRLNLHDPNVCTSYVDWRTASKERELPPDRFRHQLKFRINGQAIEACSNDQYVALSANGNFGSDVPFSVNRPDRIVAAFPRLLRKATTKKWRVYVDRDAGVMPQVLERADVQEAIEGLALGQGESLHIYRGGLTVYVRPKSVERVVDVVAAVATLTDHLPLIERPAPDFSELPPEFRPLVGLMDAWAKSDDEERAERLARASRRRLEDFVSKVTPHFTAINAYLDRFGGGAMSDAAAALGNLAECAVEAQLLLKRRYQQVPDHTLPPRKARQERAHKRTTSSRRR